VGVAQSLSHGVDPLCQAWGFYRGVQRTTLSVSAPRRTAESNVPNVPHLMRAVMAEAGGEPLRLVQVSTPRPGAGEVLVRVMASAVNPLDLKILAGTAEHARHPLPAILGIDMAGVIVAVGTGTQIFREGDGVFGMAGGVGGHPGTLAEYVTVEARLLALKPNNLGMREAAAVPLVFITAWEGLVDRAAVRAGQRVLIAGGAGGVGQMALQIARARGAMTFATGSQAARQAIERLGARFVDKAEAPADVLARETSGQGFDIVFDTAGGASLDTAFTMVRRFGHVVSTLGWGTHSLAPLSFRAASYSGIFTLLPLLTGEGGRHHGEILAEATKLAEAGALAPDLDPGRFTLSTVNEAYRSMETGMARGKRVVDIGEEVSS
jgi:NADPH:quinone reductase